MRARRLPNAWFLVPLVIAGVVGAVTGRSVARVSCVVGDGPGGSGCVGTEVLAAVIGAILAMVGVAVVVVLALMSIAEWRRAQEKGEEQS